MDNLNVRASWGQLGNQSIGAYPYQSVLSLNSYPFNTVEQGVAQTRLVDQSLKWETTTVTDIGFDLSVANGLFFLTADWFNKVTDDILYQIQVPASVGLSSPTVNYASMKNTGFEFEIGHFNQVGDFSYNASFNLSTYKNEVIEVKAPTYASTYTIQEGLPWQSHYLIEVEGIFQSQEEIDASATHPFTPLPGDLKFVDQNGDNVINGDDRVVVDGAFPKFYYGGSLNISWKNFDVTAFVQGVNGQKHRVTHWGIDPFIQGTPPTKDFVENMWTPDNPTNEYPAMYRQSYKPITGTNSTYHLFDATYFRLKNLVIGYNIPGDLAKRMKMKALRVYLSGDNLFTLTDYPGADPERTGGGRFATYPQLKIYTAGVKVTF
jgi:outer membrane receptor protein involved in Fe transport